MPRSGKVNPLTLLFFAAVAGGLWWVFTFSQVYLDNMDVEDAVSSGYNAVKNGLGPDQVRGQILAQVNQPTLGWHWVVNEMDERRQVGGLGLTDEHVHVVKDEATLTFHITVDYEREVQLKPSEKWRTVHFHVEKSGAYGR